MCSCIHTYLTALMLGVFQAVDSSRPRAIHCYSVQQCSRKLFAGRTEYLRLQFPHPFFKYGVAALYLLLGIAMLLSCTEKQHTIPLTIMQQRTGQPVRLMVETAVTAAEQQRGYMQRKEIPDGTGMVFIYKSDAQLNFWMKDTPHPLSIAFIDSAGRIREIYDMQPFSLAVISSTHSVRYALEVPQGFFTRAGVATGDILSRDSLQALKTAASLVN